MVDVWMKGDGGVLKRRDPGLVFHYPGKQYSALRIGNDKVFIFWKDENWGIDHVEMYDLSKDIGETDNIATANPEKANRMAAQLVAYMREVNAEKPILMKSGKRGAKKGGKAQADAQE
jgi:hypothetical protein